MKIKIEIAKNYKNWSSHKTINKLLMTNLTKNILGRFDNFKQVKNFEVSILFTHDIEMLKLNQDFRKKKNTTNVLSFPDIEIDNDHVLEFKPNLHYMYLGDVAFGYQIIKLESEQQSKSFEQHFIHLFVHSILHLLGFKHDTDQEADNMEKLEIEILKSLAIPSPYNYLNN